MLVPVAQNIWVADGPEVRGAVGFHFPTRMTVVRLPDGALWLWSPVAMTRALRDALAPLGDIRWLVAPNGLHHMFLAEWQSAFPVARTCAPAGMPDHVAVDTLLETTPPEGWGDALDMVVFPGNRITTEAVFLHRSSGTAIFTDLIQQMPPDWYTGWRRIVARLDLMTADTPQVPRKFRLAFRDKPAARHAVNRVLGWEPTSLILAHGPVLHTGATAVIRNAFDWLAE